MKNPYNRYERLKNSSLMQKDENSLNSNSAYSRYQSEYGKYNSLSSEVSGKQTELSSVNNNINDAQNQVNSLHSQKLNLEKQLEERQSEVGFMESLLEGYQPNENIAEQIKGELVGLIENEVEV